MLPIVTTVNRSLTNGGPTSRPGGYHGTVPPPSVHAKSCCRFSSRYSSTLVRSSPACGNADTNGNPGGGSQLVDNQAQVSPADLPILRVGIECTLTQLLDKGFLHAVRFHAVLVCRGTGRFCCTFFVMLPAKPTKNGRCARRCFAPSFSVRAVFPRRRSPRSQNLEAKDYRRHSRVCVVMCVGDLAEYSPSPSKRQYPVPDLNSRCTSDHGMAPRQPNTVALATFSTPGTRAHLGLSVVLVQGQTRTLERERENGGPLMWSIFRSGGWYSIWL